MKFIYIILLAVVVGACEKNEVDLVEKFVQEVKADRYYYEELPDFNIRHIDALFAHAGDEQLVGRFPWPPYSSYYPGEKEVGLVMLYAVEAIRRPESEPLRGVHVYDINEPERKVTLDEVLPLYQQWWAENKGKGASSLQKTDPMEGTGLMWLGTAVPKGL
ncbi:DUF4943 family protein [Parapedobacter sp.]